MTDRRALVTAGSGLKGRRRTAPRAEETSDVRRFRGVWLAMAVFAVTVAVGVVASYDIQAERIPGPLALPHVRAGLACASCHQSEVTADVPAARCVGCHGPHPSARAPHRKQTERGAMRCTTCHRIHRNQAGVAFLEDEAVRFDTGRQESARGVPDPAPTAGIVPLISAQVCGGCHRIDRDRDPIARCLLTGQEELGKARPTVCFDEHRALVGARLTEEKSARARLPLWEAARAVASAHPVVEAQVVGGSSPVWPWILAGLGLAAVVWPVTRQLRSREAPAQRQPPPAALQPPDVIRLPQVNTATCIGCSACVDACPYDVLELQNYVAVVARPDDCCGLTLCEQRCPNGSLLVTDGEPIDDRPRVATDLQSQDLPGVYIAGDLTGLPLIRNAINQGAHAVRSAAQSLASEAVARGAAAEEMLDVVIVGAGPAGLAAALEAKAQGLRYLALEQGSVAQSIRSFPRGKLVFDQPLGIPLVGDLWLEEASKEELLGKWLRIVRSHELAVGEGQRVTSVTRLADAPLRYRVSALDADGATRSYTARRVVLALGRRGSARKLDLEIPESLEHRVHYSLADARSFAGQRVVVVGLGDVAMEAAIALARQPGTKVTIAYRGAEFRRGKARNRAEIQRLVGAGRIELRMSTQVQALSTRHLTVATQGRTSQLDWNFMFVMIGSIPPWSFLEAIGIARTRNQPPAAPAQHRTQVV